MLTYLINLERRTDRLEQAKLEFAKTEFRPMLFKAVDGSKLPLPDEWQKAGAGALGCSLSHRAILKECIDNNIPEVAVFEDDVTFVPNFTKRFNDFMKDLPEWDAVFLGGQHITPPTILTPLYCKCVNTHRTHAYIIKLKYMKVLYDLYNTTAAHIDHTWGANQINYNVFAPTHFLCGQSHARSDINGRMLSQRFWQQRRFNQPKPPQKIDLRTL